MQTKLNIINSALSKIGAQPLMNLDDATIEGKQASLIYDGLRQSLLRKHPWNFATKRCQLQRLPDPDCDHPVDVPYDQYRPDHDPFGCDIQYAQGRNIYARNPANLGTPMSFPLPVDCLKVLDVNDNLSPYKIEGRNLCSHDYVVAISYVANITDAALFDASFCECLTLLLARDLAYPLTGNQNLVDQFQQYFDKAYVIARRDNAHEGTAENPFIYSYLHARSWGY